MQPFVGIGAWEYSRPLRHGGRPLSVHGDAMLKFQQHPYQSQRFELWHYNDRALTMAT